VSKFAGKLKGAHRGAKNELTGQAKGDGKATHPLLSFNFHQLDEQGHTFRQWQEQDLLCDMLTRMKDLSSRNINELRSDKSSAFSVYDTFPEKSEFKHPKHVPEDAVWARFHVKGKPVVAGHLVGGVFHVVFLDGDHVFYKTELKNT
jgi:hypothetical protein